MRPSDVDIVRDALQAVMRRHHPKLLDGLNTRIKQLHDEIEDVNTRRKVLSSEKETYEAALDALGEDGSLAAAAARQVLRLSIDAIRKQMATLRPTDLLQEKADLQFEKNRITSVAETVLLILGRLGQNGWNSVSGSGTEIPAAG